MSPSMRGEKITRGPIMGVCTIIEDGGNHADSRYTTDLFYKHQDKKITCISGHIHLRDSTGYNGVRYYCNGAVSGFWWEAGDKDSAGKSWCRQTPPGYAIIDLCDDGSLQNTSFPIIFEYRRQAMAGRFTHPLALRPCLPR